jgi:hypothetical protein
MIKANELRLGNWVHFTNSLGTEMNFQINVFHLAYMVEADPDYVQHGYGIKYIEGSIKGIALTPEILEKSGFVNEESDRGWTFLGFALIEDTDGLFWLNEEVYFSITPCLHLHQLQNLYFALTGQELSVNL